MAKRLDKLEQKRKELEELIKTEKKKAKARQQKEEQRAKARSRKEDERRKLLAGAAILNEVETGRMSKADFLKIIDRHIEKPADRDFMGLSKEAKTKKVSGDGEQAQASA